MADVTKDDVIEFIANMSVLESVRTGKGTWKRKFGVSAAAPVAAAGVAVAADGAGAAAEEQTEFDVIMTTFR